MIWIVAICCSEADGIRLEKLEGDVQKAKEYLAGCALNDSENNADTFDYGTVDTKDIKEVTNFATGEVEELNGYATFSNYHIDYTARRLDAIREA